MYLPYIGGFEQFESTIGQNCCKLKMKGYFNPSRKLGFKSQILPATKGFYINLKYIYDYMAHRGREHVKI